MIVSSDEVKEDILKTVRSSPEGYQEDSELGWEFPTKHNSTEDGIAGSLGISDGIQAVSWRVHVQKPVGKGEAPSVGIKNKNRSRPLQPIVNSKHSSFSR